MRLLFAACFLLSGCFLTDRGNNGTQPGACDDATKQQVTAVEVGSSDANERYQPIEDGDQVPLRTGGQGAEMVVVRLHIPELAPGTCVGEEIEILDLNGDRTAHTTTPVALDGSSMTPEIYVPGDFDAHAEHYTLIVHVEDVEVRRAIVLDPWAN
jgi:hypothetical protein